MSADSLDSALCNVVRALDLLKDVERNNDLPMEWWSRIVDIRMDVEKLDSDLRGAMAKTGGE